MGVCDAYLRFIEEQCNSIGGLHGKRMLELGGQTIRSDAIPELTGKAYFQNRGVEHVSFDLNGALGSLRIDLSRPIDRYRLLGLVPDTKWIDRFDIVTNSGTTEHIEPYEAQYECFKNIHRCLRVGGIAIHLVPDVDELEQHGHWAGHCRFYYSRDFFEVLAEGNEYRILSSCVINGLRCVALEKSRDVEFMSDRAGLLDAIAVRSEGIVYPGINNVPWYMRRAVSVVLNVSRPLRKRLSLHSGALQRFR